VKIAPPSGEFRWIHKRYLGSKKPSSSAPKTDEHALASLEVVVPATIQTVDLNVDADLPVGTSVLNSEASPEPIGSSLVSAAKPLDGDSQMSTVPMEPVKADPPVSSDVAVPSKEQVAIDSPWKSRGAEMAVASPLGTEAGNYDEDLRQINMALSAIVAQETSKWQLASVRQSTEHVIDTAQQPKQRDMARRLLKRITEFEDVKRRYDRLASNATPNVQPRSNSGSIRGENVELVAFLESNNRTTDSPSNPTPTERPPAKRTEEIAGSGWLMPVITTNPNMPKFALTDDEGQIEYFVSPEPNVNLKSYLRRRVSILGKSGFDSNLGKSHLAASKVVLQR
jgi:hypothetical protein